MVDLEVMAAEVVSMVVVEEYYLLAIMLEIIDEMEQMTI